ncbi:hypothetical protein Ancab_019915, partial [Ancistrocladus abbreviatus]
MAVLLPELPVKAPETFWFVVARRIGDLSDPNFADLQLGDCRSLLRSPPVAAPTPSYR